MGKKLTNKDYCVAAKELDGAKPAAIKAVAAVESSGDGFMPDGRIKIRFEGHKFRTFTNYAYDKTHPDISYPYSQQKSKTHGYTAFNKAFALNKTAAMLSTSWGKFQPMGFTHEEAGFDDVGEFVSFLKGGEANQLIAFVRLIKHRGLADELRRAQKKDFTTVALIYNGKSYKDNNYDGKMWTYFGTYSKEKFECDDTDEIGEEPGNLDDLQGGVDEATSEVETKDGVANGVETELTTTTKTDTSIVSQTTQQKNEQDVNTPAEVKGHQPYNGVGFIATIKKDFAAVTGGNLTFQGLSEYFQQVTGWPAWIVPVMTKLALVVLIISIIWLLFRLIHYLMYRYTETQRIKSETLVKTDTSRKDVVIT
jgi:hypothetical protein